MGCRAIGTVGLLALAAATAAAQDQQVGARTKAMGGSYTAFEDDPVSVWLNPAGIATQADGGAIAYQTYTIYEPEHKMRASGSPHHIPAEIGWTDPAIIPSYLGVVFQLGTPESPQAIGICFATPFRLEYIWTQDDPPDFILGNLASATNQTFYRIRAAYARDFRFAPPGAEGFLTHLSLGAGIDVGVTSWEYSRYYQDTSFNASLSDVGFGGGAGLLLGVYDNTRNFKVNLGAAYQSKVNYKFSLVGVPLFNWPNQYQVGLTFYLLEGMPLRLTLDAQRIEWGGAAEGEADLPGVDDFANTQNYSIGLEYRLPVSDAITLYPRAGYRRYDAPWKSGDKDDLPGVTDSQLFISPRSGVFNVFSGGLGVGWTSESGKSRTVDIAFDVGGDVPGFGAGFNMEF